MITKRTTTAKRTSVGRSTTGTKSKTSKKSTIKPTRTALSFAKTGHKTTKTHTSKEGLCSLCGHTHRKNQMSCSR